MKKRHSRSYTVSFKPNNVFLLGHPVPLLLFYYEGYSTAEIASMLSIAEKTVSTRLFRARAKLRTILEEE